MNSQRLDPPSMKGHRGGPWIVFVLCGLAVTFDGYDLVAYGTTLSSLKAEWGMTSSEAGLIGSAVLVGMMVGAISVGTITDIIGRRRAFLLAVTGFSLLMPLCAAAPNPEVFAALRFLAGIGLGGLMPVAAALVTEYAPAGRKNLVYVTMQSGYGLGGMLAAGLGIFVLPNFGWHAMYLFAAAPLVLIVPLAWASLPESVQYLRARGRHDEANEVARRMGLSLDPVVDDEAASAASGVRTLFSHEYRARTLTFWAMTFCALLLVYGLNTWLPDIMRSQGYALGSSLSFLIAFNLGSIIGVIVAGGAADKFGPRIVIAATFAIGAAATAALVVELPTAVLYTCCAIGGYGSVGVQTLNNGFIAQSYPAYASATAVGWALSVGRLGAVAGPILGGFVADSSLGTTWNFYMFAIVGVSGALLTLLLRVGYSPTRQSRAANGMASLPV